MNATIKTSSKLLVPPSPVDRYFSLHYAIHFALLTPSLSTTSDPKPTESTPSTGHDICVTRHHNGLCVICISPRHPLLRQKVTNVRYRVPFKAVQGKRKKGGIIVESNTRLCTITVASGDVYTIQTGVKGVIVEYNDNLSSMPDIITDRPLREGYLAVVLPFSRQLRTAVDHLLSAEDYDSYFDQNEMDDAKVELTEK